MRIALYHNLPPGGAARYMNEVVRRSSREHDHTTFTPNVVECDWTLRPATTALAVAREERRIAAIINAGGFDLAFVTACRVMQAPGVLSRLTIPSVYMCHEPRRRSFERGYRPGARPRAGVAKVAWSVGSALYDSVLARRDQQSVAAATALACNSAYTAEYIARAYQRDATICYPGVDCDVFSPSAATARRHYLSVGAIDVTKGHDLAIDAASLLEGDDRLPLIVVGPRSTADAAESLRVRAQRSGVDLQVRDGVSESQLVDLYRSAAATFCLARLEPFGLTAIESIASGTPVVAVHEGGFRETVIDGVNGVLVERSAGAIAAGVVRLRGLALTADASALHETARRWDWDVTVKHLHELFDDLAGAR